MNTISANQALCADAPKTRSAVFATTPDVLASIYNEDINVAVWERTSSNALTSAVADFVSSRPRPETSVVIAPSNASAVIKQEFQTLPDVLADDIAELIDMFCSLFELQHAGLRLAVLGKAMCPAFHVDRVPCRLVTTYCGVGTEWLPHQLVDRSRMGHRTPGQSDSESGLFQNSSDIQQLHCADVALLKGELWPNNEGAGLVHRSPDVPDGTMRLLLSLDFSD